MNRHSAFARAVHTLTALVTVWCLGCNAFDPLLASLLPGGGGSMMICESEAPASVASAQDGEGRAVSVSVIAEQGDQGASCDCGTCHAPPPSAVLSEQPPSPVPQQPAAEPGLAPTIARAPLVPPPQHVA